MARHESDREDLMAEATALARRMEIVLPGEREPLVVGIRREGRLSLYFGQDVAYHFDEWGRLRRAFLHGDLFRTQGTTLARLRRHPTSEASELLREDLTADELREFLAAMDERLSAIRARIAGGEGTVLRIVPEGDEALPADVCALLDVVLGNREQLAPAFPGRH